MPSFSSEQQEVGINKEIDFQARRLSVLWDCAIRLPGGKFEFECLHGLTVMQFMAKTLDDISLIAIHEKFVKLINDGMSIVQAREQCLREYMGSKHDA